MSIAVSCRKCGAPVTADARDGVCPKCLFNLAAAGSAPLISEIQNPKSRIKNLETVLHSFGDYELLEEIARGGMGVVYKARQKSLERLVAVKLILAGQFAGKQIAQRFKSEAIAAAVLQHPNVVAVHEVGVHDGHHFFSMDYVAGQNLAELVAQRALPPQNAARYVKLIAEAIHYAHGQGILHRDLKPSNVLIDFATDQPRVTDFGLARRLDGESSLTVTGQVLGSPHFMPPEQAGRRGKVGRASDVFGLGGILYFLLTARAPFQGETMEATIQQVLHAEPVSPRLLNATVPLDLETICLKCLEKEPGRRYQTAEDVVQELERFLSGEPILARPISRVGQAWRWCRRKPTIAALATATILLLLAIVIGSPIALYRIQESARRARRLLYAADMNLAQQALKLNNLGKARRLLDRHRPHLGEEDLRGWEWRYLWQLSRDNALATLTNRPTQGYSVSFSPDGKRLAVGWWDGRVDLWHVPGRRWVRALTDRPRPHSGRVAFSPAQNLLAATSEHMMVTLYDLDSGRESVLWRAPDHAEWIVRDLAFSRDGSRVIIYAGSNPEGNDAVWVVNVSSSQIESTHPAGRSRHGYDHFGAARLSPDNGRLYLTHSDYLNDRYSIQCIDLRTDEELWQTELQHGDQPTTLDVSPDGRVLTTGSGFSDPLIRVWNAASGKLLRQLDGHTAWVSDLAFTRDGRHLVSAAGDQTIRFWDTNTWTNTMVLRGHGGEVWGIAISDPAQRIASVSKDGDLKLWRKDGKRAADAYRRLSESLGPFDVQPLDHSRVLLLPRGQPPELVDLKSDSPPTLLAEIGPSTNILGCFGTNSLCVWNGTNQILVGELRGAEFVQRGGIALDSGLRPTGFTYNSTRRLVAWTEGTSSTSLYLASLAAPRRRIELKSDVPGLVPFSFSGEGNYLAARSDGRPLGDPTKGLETLRVWNVESGQIVASINRNFTDACFAANGSVLVVALHNRMSSEIGFYDLVRPDRAPKLVQGGFFTTALAVSPDGRMVSATPEDGQILLLDSAQRKLSDSIRGHLVIACDSAFSPDGRRLFSTDRGQEAVKLWDVGTRQELLTLAGTDSVLYGVPRWSADGNVILAGPPWQAWSAPSWDEIAAAEGKEKSKSNKP